MNRRYWLLVVCCLLSVMVTPRSTSFTNVVGDEEYAEEVVVDPSRIHWVQSTGPPGGRIAQLLQHPQNPNELYVLTNNGVYQSQDKGETWCHGLRT